MVVPTVTDVVNGNPVPESIPVSSSSILTRLRAETREAHKDLERILDLTGSAMTRDAYRRRIGQYYGFYNPLEAALRMRCALRDDHTGAVSSLRVTLDPRLHKTPLLLEDLHHLEVSIDALPECHDLPPLETFADILGCLYVLEGATLGGRMIAQHLHATLGITPSTGGRFFEGYAGETGRMWNAMRQLLTTSAADVAMENEIVANANATFTCLRRWCDPESAAATDTVDDQASAAARV
jgi:heme oxygenase